MLTYPPAKHNKLNPLQITKDVRYSPLTQIERNFINASDGMIIFNSDENVFQGYYNQKWNNLSGSHEQHKNTVEITSQHNIPTTIIIKKGLGQGNYLITANKGSDFASVDPKLDHTITIPAGFILTITANFNSTHDYNTERYFALYDGNNAISATYLSSSASFGSNIPIPISLIGVVAGDDKIHDLSLKCSSRPYNTNLIINSVQTIPNSAPPMTILVVPIIVYRLESTA